MSTQVMWEGSGWKPISIGDLLELHRLECVASDERLDDYAFLRDRLQSFAAEELAPPPLVSGRDLLDLGLQPGPDFKRLLRDIETAQLDGELRTRDEALARLRASVG